MKELHHFKLDSKWNIAEYYSNTAGPFPDPSLVLGRPFINLEILPTRELNRFYRFIYSEESNIDQQFLNAKDQSFYELRAFKANSNIIVLLVKEPKVDFLKSNFSALFWHSITRQSEERTIFLDDNNNLFEINKAAMAMFMLKTPSSVLISREALISKNLDSLAAYSQDNLLLKVVTTTLDSISHGGENYCFKEMTIQDKTYALIIRPLLRASIKLGYCIQLSDVSGVKDLNSKMEKQKIELIGTSRLAALGEMAAGIAHEINNPLMVISNNAEFMQRTVNSKNMSKERLIKSIEVITMTVKRIVKIVSALRSVSRDGSGETFTNISFSDLFREVLVLSEQRCRSENINIIYDPEQPPFQVLLKCRKVLLSQAFINLLNNSFDAIQNLEEKWIKISGSESNGWLEIHIKDSGPGISEDVRSKMFNPFFTTKDIGKGTGLGLSLVHGIIQGHRGNIYYNEKSSHTCFTVELPIS